MQLSEYELANFDRFQLDIEKRLPAICMIEKRYALVMAHGEWRIALAVARLHLHPVNITSREYKGQNVWACVESREVASLSELKSELDLVSHGKLSTTRGVHQLPPCDEDKLRASYYSPPISGDNNQLVERHLSIVSRSSSSQSYEIRQNEVLLEELRVSETPFTSVEDFLSHFELAHVSRSYGESNIVVEVPPAVFINNVFGVRVKIQ